MVKKKKKKKGYSVQGWPTGAVFLPFQLVYNGARSFTHARPQISQLLECTFFSELLFLETILQILCSLSFLLLYLKCNSTAPENLVYQWFHFSPCCRDVEVYTRVFQRTMMSVADVVTILTPPICERNRTLLLI